MASDFFNQLVSEEAKMAGRNTEEVDYTYSVVLASNRVLKTGAAITFTMKKPVELSDSTADSICTSVLASLDTENLEIVDGILSQLKLSLDKPVNRKGKGRFKIGRESTATTGDLKAGIQLQNGKFTSAITLRSLLKLLTIKYVTEEMQSLSTRGLVFRTGRLATSVDLFPIKMDRVNPTKLSLFYTYMLNPYSVFDPRISSYHGLSSANRNPQKLIGEALLKAAQQLVHARYSFDIKQGK